MYLYRSGRPDQATHTTDCSFWEGGRRRRRAETCEQKRPDETPPSGVVVSGGVIRLRLDGEQRVEHRGRRVSVLHPEYHCILKLLSSVLCSVAPAARGKPALAARTRMRV